MKKCEKCGFENSSSSSSCEQCATLLPTETTEDKVKETTSPPSFSLSYLCVICIIVFGVGYSVGHFGSVSKGTYNNLNSKYKILKERYESYKNKMQPYETQQETDANAAAEKATQKASERSKNIPATAPAAKNSSDYTSNNDGVITQDYKPKDNEPDWVAILTHCECVMPDFLGYDASISLREEHTTIIKTGLRYKLETSRLKTKNDGSYHKAIIIIEFTDNSYENYTVETLEVDGIKIT